MNSFKALSKSLFALTLMLAAVAVNAADEKPSGTVRITETEVMAIIGGSSGHGMLNFNGAEHKFKASGASVSASVGVEKLELTGEVYHLADLANFPGVYVQLKAGATLGTGATGMWLGNDKGVTLHLVSSNEGVALEFGSGGLEISME